MWKRLVIALLCAAAGFGFRSNYPGLGPDELLPPGDVLPNPLLESPIILGTMTFLPGTIVRYDPSTIINGPNGSVWNNNGINNLKNLNFAAGGALTFDGVPMGGACTGSDFVHAISATGIPSCSTPAGGDGGGSLPTPVSIANGGLGQGGAPAVGNILVAQSATQYLYVPMSGDATISATGAITISSVNGRPLSLPLTVANGGLGSGIAPAAAQIPIAQNATGYAPMTVAGDVTISANGTSRIVSVALQPLPLITPLGGTGSNVAPASGYLLIGQSGGIYTPRVITGDVTVSALGVITVNSVDGVAGPFAPLASPTFTGTVIAPTVSPASLSNTQVATTAFVQGAVQAAISASSLWLPVNNPTFTGTMTGPTLLLTNTSSSSIYWGSTTTPSASLSSLLPASNLNMAAGTHNAGGGLNWIADASSAAIMNLGPSGAAFWADSNLTIGGSYQPTQFAQLFRDANNANTMVLNGLPGPAASAIYYAYNDIGTYAFFDMNSSTYDVGGGVGLTDWDVANSSTLGTDAPILNIVSAPVSGAAGSEITFYATGPTGGGFQVGMFNAGTGGRVGLTLPGFGGPLGGFSSQPGSGLMIGNAYIGTQTFANLNLSGAAYWDQGAGAWIADGGAGGGAGLFQLVGNGFYFNTAGVTSAGAAVNFLQQFSIDPYGARIIHMTNNLGYAPPQIENGVLSSNSRDTFGQAMATGWPVTIYFARPMAAGAVCVATVNSNNGSNIPGVMYYASVGSPSTQVQFGCADYSGVGDCPVGTFFSYVCGSFGL